jgi:hypothetical protein
VFHAHERFRAPIQRNVIDSFDRRRAIMSMDLQESNVLKSVKRMRVAGLVFAGVVLVMNTGCNDQSEIPLAKVPPAPADFGKPVVNRKAPKFGSPDNSNELNLSK